jgi:phage terminase large subunit-like protein
VDAVAASIREFSFRQPIVVDTEGVIIVGHTRWKAAQKLGLDKVPVHVAKDLMPAQIKAYRITVVRSTKRITFPQKQSFYRALSADVPAKEGLNAHAVFLDELHARRTREMWDSLRYAGASRRQPLLLSIATAGYDRLSICWEQHAYAEQVLSGTIHNSAFFAFVAAAAPEDDWTDPVVWRKANPGFGITVSEDQFAEDCQEARESPAKENSFRRYRLN